MVPQNLKLSNFTSYGEKEQELNFSKFKLAAISGPNGAGKSSLLDAVTWCIWGTSRAGDSSDELIHSGADNMQVEFTFELDSESFTIKRRRSKKGGGSTSLELWSNSHNLTEGTIKITQEKIINILHLTFETFTNSSFLRQGHADEFTISGPTDRKRILSDILGLTHYDLLEERAKEKSKEAQTKLTLLEYQLLEIETELSQKKERETKKKQAEDEVEKIEKDILDLEQGLKNLRQEKEVLNLTFEQSNKLKQNLLESQKELEEIKLQGINRKNKIESLKKELLSLNFDEKQLSSLSSLQMQKDALEKVKQQRLELENSKTKTKSGLDLKNIQIENLNNQINELDEKLNALTKTAAKCPTCNQIVDKSHKEEVQKNLNDAKIILQEKVKNISTKDEEKLLEDLEKKLSSLEFDDKQYLKLSEDLDNLQKLQSQKEKLIGIKATIDSEEKVILELRSLFTNKKTQVEKLEIESKKLPDISIKLSSTNEQLTSFEQLLNNLRIKEKEARGILGQVTELISRSKQLEDLYNKKTAEKSVLQKEKDAYEELALAFGKKGIQAMIIETAIPEIEEEANRLLDRLTEGRMKIALETLRETKTKIETAAGKVHAQVETLDIIISDEMGDRPYENYSGGEQFRVNFAIRLALSKLLTRRAGAKLQFLVIDEGFGTQDVEGRTKIVEVLDTIKHDFEKILVITHLEELKEEFPVRIEVTKGAIGSTFAVVGV